MKKSFSKLQALLLSLLLASALTACSAARTARSVLSSTAAPTVAPAAVATPTAVPTPTAAATAVPATTAQPPASAVPAAVYPLTLTDAFGEQVVIEQEPQAIISGSPGMTEIIYALGAGDRLIGRTDYCDYPPEVSAVESIGSIRTPDIERIVELKPDLLIVSTHFTKENAAQLQELGITVLALYEEESFDGSYALVEKTGQVLNREAEAQAVVADMKAVIEEVKASVEGSKRPSVYYVVGFGESGDHTAGGDTFIGNMIELAGGANVAEDLSGWTYNLESLIEADPDIVIVSQYFDSKALFEADERYGQLSAVAGGKVFEIDNNMLDRQGVRNAEGLKALAEIINKD